MFLGILQQETTLSLKQDDSAARKEAGGRTREDNTQENMMNAAGEELLHRRVYTQKLLRTTIKKTVAFVAPHIQCPLSS